MDELKASGKPFRISKQEVWDAWLKVKGNQGAPGVDGQSIEAFEADLKNNLYRIWNRMSSGTYFPPPVMAVEIPKPHGGGTRVLGVPCVADRIAQTVAAARLEEAVEPVFHPDSYGYRPGRSQLDAAGACRERCWEYNWVIDLDIRKFFDSVRWDLIVKAVEAHTSHETRWVVLYVKRWLAAALQLPDGTLQERDRGTPQGSAITPPTQQRTFAHVTLRVGGVVAAAAAGWFPDGDAVADGDLLGADEDVLDDGAQDALAVLDDGGGGAAAEPGEEALNVAGELEVGVAVGGVGVEGGDLVLQAGLAGAQGRHAGAELVDGDELLGEGGDHRGDGRGGLGEGLLELAALAGDRV